MRFNRSLMVAIMGFTLFLSSPTQILTYQHLQFQIQMDFLACNWSLWEVFDVPALVFILFLYTLTCYSSFYLCYLYLIQVLNSDTANHHLYANILLGTLLEPISVMSPFHQTNLSSTLVSWAEMASWVNNFTLLKHPGFPIWCDWWPKLLINF